MSKSPFLEGIRTIIRTMHYSIQTESEAEALAIIEQMKPPHNLMFSLLYGSGLRKAELLRLRIKDIDFDNSSVYIFRGKGGKDRVTLLPASLVEQVIP